MMLLSIFFSKLFYQMIVFRKHQLSQISMKIVILWLFGEHVTIDFFRGSAGDEILLCFGSQVNDSDSLEPLVSQMTKLSFNDDFCRKL